VGKVGGTLITNTGQALAQLKAAMENELEGETFYRKAAAESRQARAKTLFEWLAEQEVDHYRRVKLEHDALVADQGWQDVSPAEGLTIFPTDTEEVEEELADVTGEVDAFKMAREFEERSYDIYQQAMHVVEDELGREILRQLADEERRHLELISEWLTFHLIDPHTPAHDYRRGHTHVG
jgi:rubrerythrin